MDGKVKRARENKSFDYGNYLQDYYLELVSQEMKGNAVGPSVENLDTFFSWLMDESIHKEAA